MLIAVLTNIGFDGFEQTDSSLKAYTNSPDFEEPAFKQFIDEIGITYTSREVPDKNWNEEWESNFEPVLVDDFVAIRAHFHKPVPGVEHEIIITPKMSFGTGHHATTYMMVEQMRELDFKDKTVLDFGTGTGILSILAEKRGAAKIMALDNDDWSITNATENLQENGCRNFELAETDTAATNGNYGIILANINRNVIMDNLQEMVNQLDKQGVLLLSGLLKADQAMIQEQAEKLGLVLDKVSERNNWIALKFVR
jgi:ribosomal protein L11 methyltransferase